MTDLPDWMRPPRAEGWFAEDLDSLPEAPSHTELVAPMAQDADGFEVEREMTIRLDARNRPEQDLILTTAPFDADRTRYAPEDVQLVVEVVSPESAHRDRTVKLHKYAQAGIPHYWCSRGRGRRPGRPRLRTRRTDPCVRPGRHLPHHPQAPRTVRDQPRPGRADSGGA